MELELPRRILNMLPLLVLYVRQEVKLLEEDNFTFSQYRLLKDIHRGIQQAGKLAERQGVSQPAMSKRVDAIIRRGLVKRVAHPTDRRQRELRLTPQGEALFRRVQGAVHKRIAERLSRLSEKEIQAVETGLSHLLSVLEEP